MFISEKCQATELNVLSLNSPELYSSSTSSSNLSSPLELAGDEAVSLYAESVLDETLSSEFGLLLRCRTSYKHKTKKSGNKFIQRNTRWIHNVSLCVKNPRLILTASAKNDAREKA